MTLGVLLLLGGNGYASDNWNAGAGVYRQETERYTLTIQSAGFRFGLEMKDVGGEPIRMIQAHASAGMRLGDNNSPIRRVLGVTRDEAGHDVLRVEAVDGQIAEVTVIAQDYALRFRVVPETRGTKVAMLLGEMGPAYGLADGAGLLPTTNLHGHDVLGMRNDGHVCRFLSTFMVFPRHRFAGVVFYPGETSVGNRDGRYFMCSGDGLGNQIREINFYYFMGDMTQVYDAYRKARDEQGYPGVAPKARFFELGWETWDWLRFNTSTAQVQSALTQFMDARGYPIRWAVTGSGFWDEDEGFLNRQSTTSFGVFHRGKYPNPEAFVDWMHDRDIHWLIGMRTNFVMQPDSDRYVQGPFSDEAARHGYLLRNNDGSVFAGYSSVFPKTSPLGMLDGNNRDAVDWYGRQYNRWMADGVKEDSMIAGTDGSGNDPALPRFDIYNGPMVRLAVDADPSDDTDGNGEMVMARNAMFSSPGTLMRINDSNINQMWNRIPINWLQNAAVGAPNAYADTVNFGQFNSNRIGSIRYGWMCAMTAGLTFSPPPNEQWSDAELQSLDALVWFHHTIGPYMYSAAVESHATGYPHTMTPLPIAFPDDEGGYDLANTTDQMFEWMIGPSLLATPLMHSRYHSTNRMDIYLPPGRWMNYNTGEVYEGPVTLEGIEMKPEHVPAFVGGAGILVTRSRDSQALTGRVYPVAPSGARYTVYPMDGGASSTIVAGHTVWDTDAMHVIDTSDGEHVAFTLDAVTGAVVFEVEPGHDYRLTTPDGGGR